MSKYYLFQDVKNCIDCRSCEVTCKSNKNLPLGPRLCEIIAVGPSLIGNLPRAAYTFMPCFHCEDPWCVAACPTGAMQKRRKDGIVFVDHAICVGCKTCMSACPWGAPQWNEQMGKVVKCDYCKDRVDEGLKPACVTVCTTHCLHFDAANEIPAIRRKRHALATASLG
ncbi:MAG: 4Fe-4S binding protein [Deltaproteobacteria bacterium]|nr:4Fe-4S binding protein [Deltaproteobacteria bacterium]